MVNRAEVRDFLMSHRAKIAPKDVGLHASSNRRVKGVLSHQVSMWLHRLNFALVALIWLHVHLINRITDHLGFMVLFDVYTLAVLVVWAWWKWVAPDTYLTGSVTENSPLNEHTRNVTVLLDTPTQKAAPGDFYFVRFEAPGLSHEWHPFSATDASQNALVFTIRQIGDFTRTASTIPIDTMVRLDGPYGRFDRNVAAYPRGVPLVLVGMGAGIAPMMSLLEGHLRERPIHVMWSIHSPEDNYYDRLLHEDEREGHGSVQVTTKIGRFGVDQFRHLLTQREVDDAAFFIVGPSRAVLSTKHILRRLGVARNRIYDERMTM